MKYSFVLILLILSVSVLSAQVLTCRQIQETTSASGDSPHNGQSVTVQGIVTGIRYYTGSTASNYGFYISDPEGGPWSGLFVYNTQNSPLVGDKVQLTGSITEYYNFTELTSLTSYQVLSQGNPLPAPTVVTSGTLSFPATAEQYESVYVMVQNVNVLSAPNSYGEFNISDGSGSCQVDNQFFDIGHTWSGISMGQTWAEIRGLVDYSFSYYAINPRNMNDMVREYTLVNAAVWIQSETANIDENVTVSVQTSRLRSNYNVSEYTARIAFDPALIKYQGVDITGTLTLSNAVQVTLAATEDYVDIYYPAYDSGDYDGPMTSDTDGADLIKLIFTPVEYGEAIVSFGYFKYNDVSLASLNSGKVITPIRKKMAFLNISNDMNDKNIFNPSLNEKITIKYGYRLKDSDINAKATIRIYDVQGRQVNTIVNKNISAANGIEAFVWNGRDTNMNLLPIGVYYCHLEIVERDSGNREETVQPIVISSKLK